MKLLISDVYSSIKTQTVVNQFAEIVKRAFQLLFNERINERLKSALTEDEKVSSETMTSITSAKENQNNGIETTEEEHEAYLTIKAILREVVDVNRIFMLDAVSYCAINLDDNNRKTFCRLRFNLSNKSIGIAGDDKQEVKITINDLSDIYNYAEELKKSVKSFDK